MNLSHLLTSNLHIAERVACTLRQKNHQICQKHQSHKKTTTLERSTKRQLFPVPQLDHHSATFPLTLSDLQLEKNAKIMNHLKFSLGSF